MVVLALGIGSDLCIFHDGNHSHIEDSGTGTATIASNTIAIVNAASNANYNCI